MSACRRMKLDPYLTNSKWIRDLNVKPETLKLIEGNTGCTLHNRGVETNFLLRNLRPKMYKWDHIKLKNFCKAKDAVNLVKRKPTEWKGSFSSYTSDRGLISRIHRPLKRQNKTNNKNNIQKWIID